MGPRLAWRLFGAGVVEDQIRAVQTLAKGARQQRHLTGAYLNLF